MTLCCVYSVHKCEVKQLNLSLSLSSGKVVIDAFRLTDPRMQAMGHEPRQTTSNLGHLQKPSIQALIHGLGRHYYSLPINYRKNELEQRVRICVTKHLR